MPQADKLENVRQLAAGVRAGITNPTALRELLDVRQRHFSYYRQAALILGVVAESESAELSLTDIGKGILATVEGSEDERQRFRDAMLAAPSLRPFSSFLGGEDVPMSSIVHRLGRVAGLSETTAKRRAQTLAKWRRFVAGAVRDGAGLTIPPIGERIGREVALHNAKAQQDYLRYLMKGQPTAFERLIADLAGAMGYERVDHVGRPGDGGVDVRVASTDKWGHETRVVIQAKRYGKNVGTRAIRS